MDWFRKGVVPPHPGNPKHPPIKRLVGHSSFTKPQHVSVHGPVGGGDDAKTRPMMRPTAIFSRTGPGSFRQLPDDLTAFRKPPSPRS